MSGRALRAALIGAQTIALLTSCVTAERIAPPTTGPPAAEPTPFAVRPTPTSLPAGAALRLPLPAVVTWDFDGRELLYVSEAAPAVIHLRALDSGAETSVAVPAGRQVLGADLVREGVAYLAAVGGDRYRPETFEIRLYDRARQRDVLLEAVPVLLEGETVTGPAVIGSKDRTALVWSLYEQRDGDVHTVLRRRGAVDGSVNTLHRMRGIVAPMALFGTDLIVWRRPFGAGNAPASLDTFVVSRGQERLLKRGGWDVDVAADGRALLQFGESAEIRQGLEGPVQMRLALGSLAAGLSLGPGVIAGRRVAWWSEGGFVSVVDLDRGTAQRYEAKDGGPRIYLDESSVIWLEARPGGLTLVRLQLP